ncbi:uncharacterized protein BDZ83DRAFT_34872 [Colletotrichum acutatum]|uniref:Uncharacterized protein n=1 Tax=Glomerella acutata TaxID=27357 RepID=A0AAD9CZU1_GLOAC|nr:uncharacterized protein BDZ83DRAFT_34872 [Colletotrichum acutatum]KAK1729533.1 hypothetical protein BDZ83DRAFT_34872 [Colletotrichum acutatum]
MPLCSIPHGNNKVMLRLLRYVAAVGPTLGLGASDYLLTPLIRPQQNPISTQGTVSLKPVDNVLNPAHKGGSPVDSPKFRSRHMPRLVSPRQQTLTGRAIEALEPPSTTLRGESVLNYPRLFWNFCCVPTGILFPPGGGGGMLKVVEPLPGALPCGQSSKKHHNTLCPRQPSALTCPRSRGILTTLETETRGMISLTEDT